MTLLRCLAACLLAMVSCGTLLAQADDDFGYGLSVSAEHKLVKGLKLQAEAEVRSQSQFSALERWSFDLGLDYKVTSWMKTDLGYVLMDRYHLSRVTSKGNVVSGHWAPRHRWYAGVTFQHEMGRFKLSLRERYQITHSPLQYVPKYSADPQFGIGRPTGQRLTDEVEAGDQDHILRSRMQLTYNIRHCRFTPSASIELLNDLADGFAVDQLRYSVGVDYSFNKRSSLSLTWRYKDRADNDEANGHLFTLGYNFQF